MMPAGKYYVGDLCHVMDEEWEEFCKLTINGNGSIDGEFSLNSGVRFASFETKNGTGQYKDNFGKLYTVEASIIGCILVDDIIDHNADLSQGTIQDFKESFCPYIDNGVITFNQVCINAEPEDN